MLFRSTRSWMTALLLGLGALVASPANAQVQFISSLDTDSIRLVSRNQQFVVFDITNSQGNTFQRVYDASTGAPISEVTSSGQSFTFSGCAQTLSSPNFECTAEGTDGSKTTAGLVPLSSLLAVTGLGVSYASATQPALDQSIREQAEAAARETQTEIATTESAKESARATSRAVGAMLSGRIASVLAPRPGFKGDAQGADRAEEKHYAVAPASGVATGLAAGEEAARRVGVWTNGAVSILSNTRSLQRFNGALWNALAGVDLTLHDRYTFGVAAGWEYSDLGFSSGGRSATNGFGVAPYVGVDLWKQTLLELQGAFFWSSTNGVDSLDYDSFRPMFAALLTQHHQVGSWNLAASVGWQYTYNDVMTNSRVEDAQIGEIKAGGRVGYLFESWEPYVAANYIYDTLGDPDLDVDEVEMLLGAAIQATDHWLLSLEAANSFFRDHEYNTRIQANIRYDF